MVNELPKCWVGVNNEVVEFEFQYYLGQLYLSFDDDLFSKHEKDVAFLDELRRRIFGGYFQFVN